MTDRELLEMAAKAAGIGIDPIDAMHEPDEWYAWNPLIDDGDALRLAVKLKIEIVISDQSATAVVGMIGYIEPLCADHNAATRRAIVRAAAEIGKNTSVTK